jgi:hypothetical protein
MDSENRTGAPLPAMTDAAVERFARSALGRRPSANGAGLDPS